MADEENVVTPDTEASPPPAAKEDPYGKYDDSERDVIRRYNEQLDSMDPRDRAMLVHNALTRAVPEPDAPQPKPTPKIEAGDDDDPVAAVRSEVKALREELKAERIQKAAAEARQQFFGTLSRELEAVPTRMRPAVRAQVLADIGDTGELPRNMRAFIKERSETVKGWFGEEKDAGADDDYAAQKERDARATLGESGRVTASAHRNRKPSGNDLESGATLDRLIAAAGGRR